MVVIQLLIEVNEQNKEKKTLSDHPGGHQMEYQIRRK